MAFGRRMSKKKDAKTVTVAMPTVHYSSTTGTYTLGGSVAGAGFSPGAFDGSAFVAGSVQGLRTLVLSESDPRLLSVHSPHMWAAGENVARCLDPMAVAYGTFNPHRAGKIGCTCGFYAYTNGENTYYKYPQHHVGAVIEGYGIVTVGIKGFRAEKAKIIALFAAEEIITKSWHVLAQYDVPIYTRQDDMLAQHPLTNQEGQK